MNEEIPCKGCILLPVCKQKYGFYFKKDLPFNGFFKLVDRCYIFKKYWSERTILRTDLVKATSEIYE